MRTAARQLLMGSASLTAFVWTSGCFQEESDSPDVEVLDTDELSDPLPSDSGVEDIPGVECCPVNPDQRFCGAEVLLGGMMPADRICPGWIDDGFGPPNRFWTLGEDAFGCPQWTLTEPTAEQCAPQDAGLPPTDSGGADTGTPDVPPDVDPSDGGPQDSADVADAATDAVEADATEGSSAADAADGSDDVDAEDGSGAETPGGG